MDVITINTDCQEEYERKVRSFLEYGYELKSCHVDIMELQVTIVFLTGWQF